MGESLNYILIGGIFKSRRWKRLRSCRWWCYEYQRGIWIQWHWIKHILIILLGLGGALPPVELALPLVGLPLLPEPTLFWLLVLGKELLRNQSNEVSASKDPPSETPTLSPSSSSGAPAAVLVKKSQTSAKFSFGVFPSPFSSKKLMLYPWRLNGARLSDTQPSTKVR